jgi:hypothetical protein
MPEPKTYRKVRAFESKQIALCYAAFLDRLYRHDHGVEASNFTVRSGKKSGTWEVAVHIYGYLGGIKSTEMDFDTLLEMGLLDPARLKPEDRKRVEQL